jgi:hypothetical protein
VTVCNDGAPGRIRVYDLGTADEIRTPTHPTHVPPQVFRPRQRHRRIL